MPSRASRPAAAAVLVTAAVLGFGGGALLGQQVGAGPEEPETSATAEPDPTEDAPGAGISLTAEPGSVSANQDIRLTGTMQPATGGVSLQVERSLDGGEWQDFPVTATTGEDGSFGVTVRSGRTGENRFRVVGEVDGEPLTSDEVAVSIG